MASEPNARRESLEKRINELTPEKRAALEKLLRERSSDGSGRFSTIARRPPGKPVPLSYAQERLWFLDRLMPGNTLYNLSSAYRIQENVNPAVLESSLNEMVRRHESLRTTFRPLNGEPYQIIAPSYWIPLHLMDLRSMPSRKREAAASRLTAEESQRPFDLSRGPLLRSTLVRMDETDYLFVLTMHHIISDGWSMGVFWTELSAIWDAFASGQPSPLPDLRVQYGDFAIWQREWLQGEVLEKQLTYWKNQLAGMEVLQLPIDRPRPAMQSTAGAVSNFSLPAGLAAALRSISQTEGATLFMTLLAAFQTLLSRYTNQQDIVVGTFHANRNRTEIEPLIGFFVNSLVLRTDFSGTPSFREVLRRVRKSTLDAYRYSDLPFARLVMELQPERDLSRNPLFQVALQLLEGTRERDEDAGAPIQEVTRLTSILDLTCTVWDSGAGLHGEFEYNTDLMDATTVSRMATHYQALLESVIAEPDRPIVDLPLLSAAERAQIVEEWNTTRADYPPEQTVATLFEAQAAQNAGATALVCGQEEVTYAELNCRANRLAHFLRKMGAAPDVPVGICAERSTEMVVCVLAVLKAGAAYVPLDPAYPRDRLALIMEDAGLGLLLTQESLLQRLPQPSCPAVCLDREYAPIAKESDRNPELSAGPSNLAYVIYTSGSTGRPKGIEISHHAVCNFLQSTQHAPGMSSKDVIIAITTLSFDIAAVELLLPLTVGALIAVASADVGRDAHFLKKEIAARHPTVLQGTPATWRMLIDAGWEGDSGLRVFSTGEELPRELAAELQSRSAEVWNLYGPTETTIWATARKLGPGEEGTGPATIPIGRPLRNVQTYIVDRNLQPVPTGVSGELLIGGVCLARGYRNLPELTTEKFIPNPFSSQPGERVYRTGDSARYLDNGDIEFLGRLDRQVKIRGFRIEPGEIEAVLAQNAAIQQARVVLHVDHIGEKRLVAYVVRSANSDGQAEQGAPGRNTDQIKRWQEVWDETYRRQPTHEDPAFNLSGWNSNYTGMPFPVEEMKEWVDQAAAKVLALKPQKVLEIGSGSGLLLFRVAPHTTHYCGTDISSAALEYVAQHLNDCALKNVTLLRRSADDFRELEPGSFDTVVLNSVVQYFPSIDYAIRVLEGAMRVLRPGGRIFLGDVRSLPLQAAFHSSVELHRAPASVSVAQLRQRIQKRETEEEQLVIDPAFFFALRRLFPRISNIQVEPKRGRYSNELTKFRYEVTLELDAERSESGSSVWLDWTKDHLNVPSLRQVLRETKPDSLGVSEIPNVRLTSEIGARELLETAHGLDMVADIRNRLESFPQTGVDLETLWALESEESYAVHLRWSGPGADHCCDALLLRRKEGSANGVSPVPSGRSFDDSGKPWTAYANDPVMGIRAQSLGPELRRFLQTKLPDHMIPATFVTLDSLPLTPSRKVDLGALPPPDWSRPVIRESYVVPRTSTEEKVAGIWAQLLGVKRVGAYDNFFELGGHSLLAIRVLSRLREAFDVDVSLRAFFEAPTIAGLAELIEQARGRGEKDQSGRIVRISREAHTATLLPGGLVSLGDLAKGRRGPTKIDYTEQAGSGRPA